MFRLYFCFVFFSGGEKQVEKYGWIVEKAMSSRHIGINSTQTHSMLMVLGDGSKLCDGRNWILVHLCVDSDERTTETIESRHFSWEIPDFLGKDSVPLMKT